MNTRKRTSRPALCCLGVILFFLGAYLLAGGRGFYSTDGETMLRVTWAVVDKGRLSVPCDPGQPSAIEGRDGRCYSRYGLGQPVVAIPLYLVGKGVSALFSQFDYGEVLRFTMARFNQLIMALVCGVMCALSLIVYRSARMGVGLALLFGLSTLALPYSRFYFNEPLTLLGFSIALLGLLNYRQDARARWLMIGGLGFGLSVLTRTVSALLLPTFLVYLWFADFPATGGADRHREPSDEPREIGAGGTQAGRFRVQIRRIMLFLLPIVVLGMVQVAYQWWAFGDPLSGGYRGEGWQTPLWLGLYGLLFSPGKSLLLFVPLSLLSAWGWIYWIGAERRCEALLCISCFLLWLLFHAGWWTWHGGWSWGPRFMLPILPFFLLPIGSLWRTGSGARAVIIALALVGFVVQLGGVLVNFGDYMLWINDEDKILFNPAFTPLVGHWRMLLNGARPDLAILDVPRWGATVWAAVCGLLIWIGVRLMRTALNHADKEVGGER